VKLFPPRAARAALLSAGAAGLLLAATAARAAPDDVRHLLGVSLALRADTVREDLLVPLSFSGPGIRLGGFYQGAVGPGLLEARLELGLRLLENRFGHEAYGLDHGLAVAWVLPVVAGDRLRLALGPAVAWETRLTYLESWDDAHGYWLGARWLGPAARMDVALGSAWRLEASPSVALLGYVGRPPAYRYHKQDALESLDYHVLGPQEDADFATLADFQAAALRLAFRRVSFDAGPLADGLSFGVDGRLARASDPATVVDLEAALWAAWAWRL
jgi:hypothetical protein